MSFRPHFSGTKKEPKPKLLSPDIFWWGGGLPREGVGAKKFGMSLETQGIKLLWRDIPGFCRDIPAAPEKFEKKMFGFNFRSLISPYSNGAVQIRLWVWSSLKNAILRCPGLRCRGLGLPQLGLVAFPALRWARVRLFKSDTRVSKHERFGALFEHWC